jgi:hypothetical protein
VWVPNDSKLDLNSGLEGFARSVDQEDCHRQPAARSVRQSCIAALQKENIYDQVKDKFVLGKHFVDSVVCRVRRGRCIIALARAVAI